jgi:hypothetical protein
MTTRICKELLRKSSHFSKVCKISETLRHLTPITCVCKIRETLEAFDFYDKRVHGAPCNLTSSSCILVLILSICVAAVLIAGVLLAGCFFQRGGLNNSFCQSAYWFRPGQIFHHKGGTCLHFLIVFDLRSCPDPQRGRKLYVLRHPDLLRG